jgi:hypothetical protein
MIDKKVKEWWKSSYYISVHLPIPENERLPISENERLPISENERLPINVDTALDSFDYIP